MSARRRRSLAIEFLEGRLVLSAVAMGLGETAHLQPTIVAGDPSAVPADAPANRVDPNTTTSPFAGVGSLFMRLGKGPYGYICTGTPIDATHVVTAGHCLDTNNDGLSDFKPDRVSFQLNFGGNLTHTIQAAALDIHPAYTGFDSPSVNDDLAIVTLATDLPAGVPTYALPTAPVDVGETLTMVGYGRSGDGVSGYYVDASFSVKRFGANNADVLLGDDEGVGTESEVFLFDFDGPTAGQSGSFGGSSLGNTVETTLGGGDSGGPSLINVGGTWQLAGVNTFTISGGEFNSAPLFGSGGGGILVHAYLDWIQSVLTTPGGGGGGDGGAGGGSKGGGKGGGPKRTGDVSSFASGYDVTSPSAFPSGTQPASDLGGAPGNEGIEFQAFEFNTETAELAGFLPQMGDEPWHDVPGVASHENADSRDTQEARVLPVWLDENTIDELAAALAG